MRNFELVGNGNKFTTVPIAGSLFHREPIGDQGYAKYRPARYVINFLKFHSRKVIRCPVNRYLYEKMAYSIRFSEP